MSQTIDGKIVRWYKGVPLVFEEHVSVVDRAIQLEAEEVEQTLGHSYNTRQNIRCRYNPYREVGEDIGTMGGLISRGQQMVTRVIKQLKTDGNGNFEPHQIESSSEPLARIPIKIEMALDQPTEPKEEQLKHAWNPSDRSFNIFVKENDPFTFHRYKLI